MNVPTGFLAVLLGIVLWLFCVGVIAAQMIVGVAAGRHLAADKGLAPGFKWFGLLGWLGLVILAFLPRKNAPAGSAASAPAPVPAAPGAPANGGPAL